MAQFDFCMDEDLKKSIEQTCADVGNADPFYSESNMAHLQRGIAALNAGKGVEHEPIEVGS